MILEQKNMRKKRQTDRTNRGQKLPKTTLCAIVRDELVNPAGGIVDFVHSTVPYVESAVIVDTGSIDGTREALVELQKKYVHLRVLDHVFDGYASSRNASLAAARTEYVLVLDADERLTPQDFREVKQTMIISPCEGYNFKFLHLDEYGNDRCFPRHNPRLFQRVSTGICARRYHFQVWEMLSDSTGFEDINYRDVPIAIKHFLPPHEAVTIKKQEWYDATFKGGLTCASKGPALCPLFKLWKAYNPQRDKYR